MSSSSRLPALPLSSSTDQRRETAGPVAQLITLGELLDIVPFSRQHILRLEKKGRFPRRLRLGDNRVAWLRAEIEQWINAKVAEREERRSS